MLVALILASGKGTRLAPLSTEERPKQYLSLITEKTLVEDTVNRVNGFIKPENIYVVTNEAHQNLAYKKFDYLPKNNIILEPEMKETLASITHAVGYITKEKGDDVEILILPSDHYIDDNDKFKESILLGHKIALKNNNFMMYGVKPTNPSPEFGYIETKAVNNDLIITNFVEKPKQEIANALFASGNYYWNNFIMIFKKEILFESIKELLPDQYELLDSYTKGLIDTNEYFDKTLVGSFSRLVLEKQQNMNLVPADYIWYDVGGFDSLFEILEKLELYEKLNDIKKQMN